MNLHRHCDDRGDQDVTKMKRLLTHFLQGVDVYVLCVCVYAHTHTLHVGYSDVSPGVGTRHLESPEEIQMYYSDSIHIYRAVYEVHMYIYICWATGRSLD